MTPTICHIKYSTTIHNIKYSPTISNIKYFPTIFNIEYSPTIDKIKYKHFLEHIFIISNILPLYDKVSRKLNNGVPNAKKLITSPIMAVTSPNSTHITFTYTKFRFGHFGTKLTPHHGQKVSYVLKVGLFSCPVQKVTPKYGSTVKTLTLKICATLFLGASIYVGSMSFHFHNIFQ